MGSKYSVHLVEMVRNNGNSDVKKNNKGIFFMFDYFDVLYYKELTGDTKCYLDYFAIRDTFDNDKDYKVSYKSLSLYQYTNKVSAVNPFLYGQDGEMSNYPFIGIVQISLCRNNFASGKVDDIDGFLNKCEDYINRIVRHQIDEKEYGNLPRQIYRSSTTGDFCLVLRSDNVEKIYAITCSLNESQYHMDDISVITYTNVGIECRMKDGKYCTLSDAFVQEHGDMTFALRFSADNELVRMVEEYEGSKKGNHPTGKRVERLKGLFGRYDYLLNIGIAEFAQIYPVLCRKKFGKDGDCESREKPDELEKIIQYAYVRNINERVLVSLEERYLLSGNGEPVEDLDSDFVINKNEKLYKKIEKLRKNWKNQFPKEHLSRFIPKRGICDSSV